VPGSGWPSGPCCGSSCPPSSAGISMICSRLSMLSRLWPSTTSRVRSPSTTEPPGRERPFASSAVLMSSSVRPFSARASSSGVMRTISSGAPITATEETPETRSSSGVTEDSSREESSEGSRSEETDSTTAGRSLVPPAITCGSASSGKSSSMPLSAASTWLEERAPSVPQVRSTVTIETPAPEVEEAPATVSGTLRSCSTGPVILSCTCSDEEPCAVVITWICGSETEGMSSWRIVVMMNTPMMDTAMHTSAMKDLLFRLSVARRFILLLEGCATGGVWQKGARHAAQRWVAVPTAPRAPSHARLGEQTRPSSVTASHNGRVPASPSPDDAPRQERARRTVDREILVLAIPSLGALVAEPLFLLADSAFIARVSTTSLAGLGLASTVLTTIVGLAIFLAYSTTAAVARSFGAGRIREAISRGIDACWVALAVGAAAALLLLVAGGPLLAAFGPSPEVLAEALIYLRISALGLPAMLAVQAATGLVRGLQDAKLPLVVAVGGALVNIPLNWVLIFGLDLGIAGSAIGTVLSQWGMAAVLLGVIIRRALRE